MQTKFLHYFSRDIRETNFVSVFSVNNESDKRILTYAPGKIYVNLTALKNAEAEIDWRQYQLPQNHNGTTFKDIADEGKLVEGSEQVFILKHDGMNDNSYLHDVPHYVLLDSMTRIFDSYQFAFYYAMYRRDKSSSIWQYNNCRLHLLHHFVMA